MKLENTKYINDRSEMPGYQFGELNGLYKLMKINANRAVKRTSLILFFFSYMYAGILELSMFLFVFKAQM
jgi:hypothetical protein